MKGFELTASPDAHGLDVAKATVKIVDMPFGTRPFRVHIAPPRTQPRSSMVLPTVSVRNCYGTCSSRIYSGHRQLKSRLRKLRNARTEVRFWVLTGHPEVIPSIDDDRVKAFEVEPAIRPVFHRVFCVPSLSQTL